MRPFLLLAFLSIDLSSAVLAAAAQPNILVIVADDLGYADIGVHGGKAVPRPNLDALAASGVRCTDGYVSAPYCSPSRAGFPMPSTSSTPRNGRQKSAATDKRTGFRSVRIAIASSMKCSALICIGR